MRTGSAPVDPPQLDRLHRSPHAGGEVLDRPGRDVVGVGLKSVGGVEEDRRHRVGPEPVEQRPVGLDHGRRRLPGPHDGQQPGHQGKRVGPVASSINSATRSGCWAWRSWSPTIHRVNDQLRADAGPATSSRLPAIQRWLFGSSAGSTSTGTPTRGVAGRGAVLPQVAQDRQVVGAGQPRPDGAVGAASRRWPGLPAMPASGQSGWFALGSSVRKSAAGVPIRWGGAMAASHAGQSGKRWHQLSRPPIHQDQPSGGVGVTHGRVRGPRWHPSSGRRPTGGCRRASRGPRAGPAGRSVRVAKS